MKKEIKKIKLTFYGGAGFVTGAMFLLNENILIDCGLIQGGGRYNLDNEKKFSFDPSSIDSLVVTHAHLDHIGRIPKLVKDGFKGKIYSTPATRDLAELSFYDALSVMKYENRTPLYSKEDIEKTLSLWSNLNYGITKNIGEGFTLYFKDAGHILGSAIAEILYNETTIAFIGDLGNPPSVLVKDTEVVDNAKYIVMESVYGNREHKERGKQLQNLVENLKGTLIIPAFSIERTQVLLYELNNMDLNIPVFLDSPLAIKATEIYRKYTKLFNERAKDILSSDNDIFDFPMLTLVKSHRESIKIHSTPNPKIIIAGSGMSHGGRVIFHEKEYLSSPDNIILFAGYQVPGTLGRLIQEGERTVKIGRKKVRVKARVEKLDGYSAHADREGLFKFAEKASQTAKKYFVCMGEPKSSSFLAQRIKDYLNKEAIVPELGQSFDLEF